MKLTRQTGKECGCIDEKQHKVLNQN